MTTFTPYKQTNNTMTQKAKTEVQQIKRLIKVNRAMMAKDSNCVQSAKFLANCSKINELLNGSKYCISINSNN